MMPAGKYYIGDLCYVMHEEWDQVCGLFFSGRNDHGCNEGEFNLKDGRRFASFNTKWGDGSYEDQFGNLYGVDAGLIGCIKLEDIDMKCGENFTRGGNLVEFSNPFECSYQDGVIVFGHVRIDTDPSNSESYDDEY